MDFAFIVPEAHLSLAALSRTQLVLSAYWKKSRAYREFYRAMKRRGDFILVDNGIHEYDFERSDEWETLDSILYDLEPDVMAVPEAVEFQPDRLLENLDWIATTRATFGKLKTEFLFVPRSTYFGDAITELEFLIEEDTDRSIRYLGIHKGLEQLAKRNQGGRLAYWCALHDYLKAYKLWMFGNYRNPIGEIKSFRGIPNVVGTDSSKPWRLASQGRNISEASPYPRRFDFKDEVEDRSVLRFVESQFREFREWVVNGNGDYIKR